MIEVIAFDADDTLWHNEANYSRGKLEFAGLLQTYQPIEHCRQFLDETEIKNIRYFGYGIKSFTLSMIDAAIQLSQGKISGAELEKILDIGRKMLLAEIELFPGVRETLDALSQRYPLLLITKGEPIEQEGKISRSGIGSFFRYIEIVGEKSVDVYRLLLSRHHIEPQNFVMIGNSLRSDIQPVLQLGGKAIYIPQESTWFHENILEAEIPADAYFQLEKISQLPELLEQINS